MVEFEKLKVNQTVEFLRNKSGKNVNGEVMTDVGVIEHIQDPTQVLIRKGKKSWMGHSAYITRIL